MTPSIKTSLTCLFSIWSLFCTFPVYANQESQVDELSVDQAAKLKRRFAEQHNKLIPIVVVADMFFACNQARRFDNIDYKLQTLIMNMDKDELAIKLASCLAGDTMHSDVAINFGLLGCFHDQLAHLPQAERDQKLTLVKQAIVALSKSERKKTLTHCVTEQAIRYLK